jgi:hypothetical protein
MPADAVAGQQQQEQQHQQHQQHRHSRSRQTRAARAGEWRRPPRRPEAATARPDAAVASGGSWDWGDHLDADHWGSSNCLGGSSRRSLGGYAGEGGDASACDVISALAARGGGAAAWPRPARPRE